MIAHLVRTYLPPRISKEITCITCGEQFKTETHYVVYCLKCGQPLQVPPNP
ncbi:MAG: hypothetical protein ACE5FN_06535 [Leptospirillia bacterium]